MNLESHRDFFNAVRESDIAEDTRLVLNVPAHRVPAVSMSTTHNDSEIGAEHG